MGFFGEATRSGVQDQDLSSFADRSGSFQGDDLEFYRGTTAEGNKISGTSD